MLIDLVWQQTQKAEVLNAAFASVLPIQATVLGETGQGEK